MLVFAAIVMVATVALLCINLFYNPVDIARRYLLLLIAGATGSSLLCGLMMRPSRSPKERSSDQGLHNIIQAQAQQIQKTDGLIRAAIARAEELNETIRAQASQAEEGDPQALVDTAIEESYAVIMNALPPHKQEADGAAPIEEATAIEAIEETEEGDPQALVDTAIKESYAVIMNALPPHKQEADGAAPIKAIETMETMQAIEAIEETEEGDPQALVDTAIEESYAVIMNAQAPHKQEADGAAPIEAATEALEEAEEEIDAHTLAATAMEEAYVKIVEAQALQKQETDGAALREAQATSGAKNNLLSIMGQKMHTPLNDIIGLSGQMLNNQDISGEYAEDLETICRAGTTLLSIVNDSLDISKIESGQFELIPAQYDTRRLIGDIIAMGATRVGKRPVQFNPTIGEGLPSALLGDEPRVKQVFSNLLSNAFACTQEGSVDWHITSEREDDSVWLVSRISGDGLHICPDDPSKPDLTMTVTQKIAEMMDGTLSLENENGKGASFLVRLRQGFVGDTPIGKEVAHALAQQAQHSGDRSLGDARVLVAGDQQPDLDVAKTLLKGYGMQVDCISSGEKAIRLIRAGVARYSAIFMDHMMPGMDGIETTRIIREEIGTRFAQTVPIIILSAENISDSKGFDACVSKPIDPAQLDAVIRRWVHSKEHQNPPQAADPPQQKAEPIKSLLELEGIDMETALNRMGGDEEALLGALRSYALNIPPVLDEIRQVSEEGLPAYAMAMHGIKGSSRSICAERLGDQAEALENAAKTGAVAFIQQNNRPFVEMLDKLLAQMQGALRLNGALPKPHRAAPSALVLNMLCEACADMDYDMAQEMVEKLERYTYETGGELVEWLRAQINVMELKKMQERLDSERLYNEGAS